jgi:prolactin regulatory element-binding protein
LSFTGTESEIQEIFFKINQKFLIFLRHLIVAGGGGAANTGIANGFEIYEIYHNGEHFVAEEIQRHETGRQIVMNMSMTQAERKILLVAGQESHNQMFIVTPKVGQLPPPETSKNRRESTAEVRQRKRTESTSQDTPSKAQATPRKDSMTSPEMKRVYFDIKSSDSIQTDFSKSDPFQRVVRISPNGKVMVTGGIDGHVRIWNFPRMTPLFDIAAHTSELDDLDFSPDNKNILSIAKDGFAKVWSTTSGKEVMKLQWTPPEGVKYMYKRGRYATIEGNNERYRMFTISNPIGKSGKVKGFLQQWNIETGRLNNITGFDEVLSTLAVRDDGRFVAVGTMSTGSVYIYIAFSLQKVLHVPNVHSMFVTGLQFIPVLDRGALPISSNLEASVVSYSVDNRICIHSLQYRREFKLFFY